MPASLYLYCWLARRDAGRTFRQSFATWRRFHLWRAPEGHTPPDLHR